ncbi:MAG: type II toxin-antitoxin system VapC family toxin [Myxococcales bacterium]|nr:type II toxin-antitoxin system VapC family toxin [Myxococcales bacterium]
MRFVLDNSVLVAWLLDESAQYADAVGARLAADQAAAPSIWPLEFANVLAVAERRGRLDAAEVVRVRDLVRALPIRVVPDPPTRVLTDVLALAREHQLSVYDASYLDLALRESLPLATLDAALAAAARRMSVPRFEP